MSSVGNESQSSIVIDALQPPTSKAPRSCPVLAVWLRDLVISLAISAFIIIFLYQPVKVEGTSMMPSLDDQERIFVNKFVAGHFEKLHQASCWAGRRSHPNRRWIGLRQR